MATFEVHDQAELDAALAKAGRYDLIEIKGSGYLELAGSSGCSDSATVTAYDSATVTAYGSATVTAYDSATVRAYGSATVTASGSATVTASGSATVRASGSATVTASKYVAIQILSRRVRAEGGAQNQVPLITTAEEFCDFFGVEVVDGIATLYKGVDAEGFTSYSRQAKIAYLPGLTPTAPDFRPTPDCGHGLHFCGRPMLTLRYNESATRFMACPVRLDAIVVIDPGTEGVDKVKAPGCCAPIYEVDIDGNRLTPAEPTPTRKVKRTRKAAAK
jgi:hypothetical protein